MSVPPWRKNKRHPVQVVPADGDVALAPDDAQRLAGAHEPKLTKQDSGRSASFDLVWGGEVVGVGVSYGAGGATEEIAPRRVAAAVAGA